MTDAIGPQVPNLGSYNFCDSVAPAAVIKLVDPALGGTRSLTLAFNVTNAAGSSVGASTVTRNNASYSQTMPTGPLAAGSYTIKASATFPGQAAAAGSYMHTAVPVPPLSP